MFSVLTDDKSMIPSGKVQRYEHMHLSGVFLMFSLPLPVPFLFILSPLLFFPLLHFLPPQSDPQTKRISQQQFGSFCRT